VNWFQASQFNRPKELISSVWMFFYFGIINQMKILLYFLVHSDISSSNLLLLTYFWFYGFCGDLLVELAENSFQSIIFRILFIHILILFINCSDSFLAFLTSISFYGPSLACASFILLSSSLFIWYCFDIFLFNLIILLLLLKIYLRSRNYFLHEACHCILVSIPFMVFSFLPWLF